MKDQPQPDIAEWIAQLPQSTPPWRRFAGEAWRSDDSNLPGPMYWLVRA